MSEEKKKITIDDLINTCMGALNNYDPGCKEYALALEALEKLTEIKRKHNEKQISKIERWINRIDPNTLLSAGVTLAVVLIILNYENVRDGIIKSKAFGLLGKRFI